MLILEGVSKFRKFPNKCWSRCCMMYSFGKKCMEPLEPQKKTWLFSIYMGLCYYPVIFRENFHKPLQYKDPIMKTWPRMTHGSSRAVFCFFFVAHFMPHIRNTTTRQQRQRTHLPPWSDHQDLPGLGIRSRTPKNPGLVFSLMYGIFDYTKTIKNQPNIWEIYQSHGSYRIQVWHGLTLDMKKFQTFVPRSCRTINKRKPPGEFAILFFDRVHWSAWNLWITRFLSCSLKRWCSWCKGQIQDVRNMGVFHRMKCF